MEGPWKWPEERTAFLKANCKFSIKRQNQNKVERKIKVLEKILSKY